MSPPRYVPLPLPGYVRRRRFCADSERIVRCPGMGGENDCFFLIDTPLEHRPIDQNLLPRSRRTERALPLMPRRRGSQSTDQHDACPVVAHLGLGAPPPLGGTRKITWLERMPTLDQYSSSCSCQISPAPHQRRQIRVAARSKERTCVTCVHMFFSTDFRFRCFLQEI